MIKIILLVFAIFLGIVYLFADETLGQTLRSQTPERTILLSQLLNAIGDQYDCYLTLETALKSGDKRYSLDQERVSLTLQKKSLKEDLEQLRQRVPNFTYQIDDHNSKIVHVIDARLTELKNYPMGKIIRRINFDGNVFDLVNAIGQQGIDVSSRGAVDTDEFRHLDFATQVHIKEKNKNVRDILTNGVPLKDHARLLWTAETGLGPGQITYVRYENNF